MTKTTHVLGLAAAGLLSAGCGGNTLEVRIWGEDFIEQGIPAQGPEVEAGFVDGWAVTFDAFLVTVGEVTAAAGHEAPALRAEGYRTYDLTRPSAGEGQSVHEAQVPQGRYDHVSYRIAPSADAENANARAEDFAAAQAAGAGLWVKGHAKKDGQSKHFTWAFPTATRYGHCAGTAEVTGAPATTQLTVHADHLFYDDLLSETPQLAFALIAAADADGDGEVTEAELRQVDLSTQERYQVGSTGVTHLWDFLAWQTGSVGHIDGEGHCEEATRE